MGIQFNFGSNSNRRGESGPLGTIILGIIFIAVGILLFAVIGKDELLSCDKAKDICTMEVKEIFSNKKEIRETIALSFIKKAEVVESESHDSDDRTTYSYRMELVTKNGTKEPAFRSGGGRSKANKQVREFNSFLSSNKNSVEIKDNLLLVRLIGLLFAFCGGFVLFRMLRGEQAIFGNTTQPTQKKLPDINEPPQEKQMKVQNIFADASSLSDAILRIAKECPEESKPMFVSTGVAIALFCAPILLTSLGFAFGTSLMEALSKVLIGEEYFSCYRVKNFCAIERKEGSKRVVKKTFSLPLIQKAEVVKIVDNTDKDNSPQYNVVLVMKKSKSKNSVNDCVGKTEAPYCRNGQIAITNTDNFSLSKASTKANKINHFLGSNEKSLKIKNVFEGFPKNAISLSFSIMGIILLCISAIVFYSAFHLIFTDPKRLPEKLSWQLSVMEFLIMSSRQK